MRALRAGWAGCTVFRSGGADSVHACFRTWVADGERCPAMVDMTVPSWSFRVLFLARGETLPPLVSSLLVKQDSFGPLKGKTSRTTSLGHILS